MSIITEYIKQHNNWRQEIENLCIKINEDAHFYIFNYDIGCDFANPIVQEARGIIIDKNTFEVACWPFRKFGNLHESYVDTIDWATARVQEKIDGSIIKLWFNKYINSWQWSTNGVINAANANTNSIRHKTFLDLIMSCTNYIDIPWSALEKDKTYIFELVGPENKVVIDYSKNYLYHIGTRSNITGAEYNTYLGMTTHDGFIEHPKEYKLNSLEDCLIAVQHLNIGDHVTNEGFVVVDAYWHRVKIKSPEYVFYHHFTNGVLLNKEKIIELLKSDDINLDNILTQFPQYKDIILYYKNEMDRVYNEMKNAVNYARQLYIECNKDRKSFALRINKENSPYKFIMFNALDNEKTVDELMARLLNSTYLSFIKDWEEVK